MARWGRRAASPSSRMRGRRGSSHAGEHVGALQREAQSHAAANWQRWGLVEEKVVEAPAGESEPDVVDADEPDGDDAPLRGDVRDESAHERAAPSGAGIMGDGASRDSHGRVGNRGRGTAPRRRSSSCSGGTGGRLGRGSGSEDETSSSSEETTRRNERRQQQPTQQSLALNGDSVAEPQFVFGAEPQVPLWQLVVHWLLAIGMRRLLEAFVLATEAPRGLPDLFNRGLFTPQTDTRVLLLTVLLIATADIPSVVTSGGDFIMRQFGYRYSWYSRRGEPVADLPEYVAVIVYIIALFADMYTGNLASCPLLGSLSFRLFGICVVHDAGANHQQPRLRTEST